MTIENNGIGVGRLHSGGATKSNLKLSQRLNRRQQAFVCAKIAGFNDKEAALTAGYSPSVAENTKQKVWKPWVRAEFNRLRGRLQEARKLDNDLA